MTTRQCPRCAGPSRPGVLQKIGNYGNPPFEWAPDGEPPFPVAGAASPRKKLVAFRCDRCSYLELYAP
jgi:hypothetical protein